MQVEQVGELAAELTDTYYTNGKRHCFMPLVVVELASALGQPRVSTLSHSLAPQSTRVNVFNVGEDFP
jgi:hypothetical protein